MTESEKLIAEFKGEFAYVIASVCHDIFAHLMKDHVRSEREQELIEKAIGSIQASLIASLSTGNIPKEEP